MFFLSLSPKVLLLGTGLLLALDLSSCSNAQEMRLHC